MKRILPLLLLLPLTGCMHIPRSAVEDYHRTTTVLTVTSTTDLQGVKVTEKTVKAETAKFTLSFPGFYDEQTVKGLVLSNPEKDKKP